MCHDLDPRSSPWFQGRQISMAYFMFSSIIQSLECNVFKWHQDHLPCDLDVKNIRMLEDQRVIVRKHLFRQTLRLTLTYWPPINSGPSQVMGNTWVKYQYWMWTSFKWHQDHFPCDLDCSLYLKNIRMSKGTVNDLIFMWYQCLRFSWIVLPTN